MNPYQALFAQNPQTNVNFNGFNQPYTPHYGSNTQLGSLINQFGSYLKPQQGFTSLEDFSKPLQETFQNLYAKPFRSEYETFQRNPYIQSQGAQLAASNAGMNGGSAKRYRNNLNQFEQQNYFDPLNSMVSQYRDSVINPAYNTQYQNYYNSPTAFNNIGM